MTGMENYTSWGLAAGEHAFYADSLGRFYMFLTHAILKHLKRDGIFIQKALILNFHVGLSCGGNYKVQTGQKLSPQKFTISLSNPNTKKPISLLRRIESGLDDTGEFILGACSAPVLVEAYEHAKPGMRRFMSRDYDSNRALGVEQFERAVMRRFDSLTGRNLTLEIFHSAADLPLTAIYLKFSGGISPRPPANTPRSPVSSKKITELLATGLYEPRYATAVVQNKCDISLPVQILVAGATEEDSKIKMQIDCLVDVYRKHIEQHSTTSRDTTVGADTVHVFLSHYKEDKNVVEALIAKLNKAAAKEKLHCKFITGVGKEMERGGKTFYENLKGLTPLIDYAIVLYPLSPTVRSNIPYELGLFAQRFMTRDEKNQPISSRAIFVADPQLIPENFSNVTGIPVVERPTTGNPDEQASGIFRKLVEIIPFLGT